ncbi:MAG TPA: FecR domain-containing protein [Thermoanaerobaculia bacterium]|nr:FecR domain-containing protein [Thermoanaerobaculia bacterium]
MASKNPSAKFDWYLISIARLKQAAVAIVLLLVGVIGYFYFTSQRKDPRKRAETAISSAEGALNQLAASKNLKQVRTDFDRGQAKVTEAKALFQSGRFPEAEAAGLESQSILESAMTREPAAKESDAQFLTVEGEVQYQKGASSDWKRASAKAGLFNGDWVRTSDNASAELIFSNGSLYTVGPNALLEIYSAINPATSKKQNTVQMQVGSVEINTSDDSSTVKTPGTQIVVQSDSTTQVGVDRKDQATEVVSIKGSSSITSSSGGSAQLVTAGETLSSTKEGALSAVRKVVMPPALLTPPENQTYQNSTSTRIDLTWDKLTAATAYQVQVSRSRLFTSTEVNSKRPQPKASIQVAEGGSFYWRVAGIDASGRIGPFSTFRRFRVKGVSASATPPQDSDKVPPVLQLKRPFNIGGQFYMVEGKTEPGATVLINDQEVDAESDGSFKKLVSFDKIGRNAIVVKAVDAAGNQTVQTESVFVEE